MAISQAFAAFMLGFSHLGLGDALVQRERRPDRVRGVFRPAHSAFRGLTIALALAGVPDRPMVRPMRGWCR